MEKTELRNIFESPFNLDKWHEVMRSLFKVKTIHQQPVQIGLPANKLAHNAFELGNTITSDERLIGFYLVNLKPSVWIEVNRVGLRDLLRNVYNNDVDGALIVFVYDDKWRFSFVSQIRELNDNDEIVQTKTEPKRFTYLMGNGEVCRTATDRFNILSGKPISLEDIKDAFSVEKLNKEFFKKYKDFHEEFSKYLSDETNGYRHLFIDKQESEIEKQEKPVRDFVKILLGRIVFIQFLQKKGWMGVPVSSETWEGGDIHFVQNLFKNYSDKQSFHSRALKILFFETLNDNRTNQIASSELGENIRIPYLNGGLFERDISFRHPIDFPSDYFARLLDFFEEYNFTIDENSPDDQEVGIDPEMLGHIFENLLEENRKSGTFYTPKEIVHYMCQESLLQYLLTHIPNCADPNSENFKALNDFVRKGFIADHDDTKNFIVKNAKLIEEKLDAVKICDPAIGSGAFPMGLLQEIMKIKSSLDLTLDRAKAKKNIIQNSIYGVDLDIGAVEIARLRFWLSLVVDEIEPQPLPSLDYKIMQGNSIKERFEGIDLKFSKAKFVTKVVKEVDLFGNVINPQYSITEYLQSQVGIQEFDITELEEKFFNSDNAVEKQAIKKKIEAFEKRFIDEQLVKRIEDFENQSHQKHKEIVDLDTTLNNSGAGITNASIAKYERALKNLERKEKENESILKEIDRLNEQRLFVIQLSPVKKPWFLWHLYFMDVFDEGGFDIVIGNPPYIKEYTDRSAFDGLRDTNYYQGKMDIWYYFACFCLDLLKQGGTECFIAQNNWISSTGASKLRKKVLNETKIELFTDFGDYKVFQSAGIQTMIYLLIKETSPKSYITKYRRQLISNIPSEYLAVFLNNINQDRQNDYVKYLFEINPSDFEDSSITFNEPWIEHILNLILENEDVIYFGEGEIAQGIVEPQDKLNKKNQKILGMDYCVGEGIFQLNNVEKDNLNLTDLEKLFIKPFYSTTHLKRYFTNSENDEWLIYTKSDIKNNIHLYPNIKRHFDRFGSIITSDFGPYGLHRARDEKFFTGEKIMSLRKCEKPTFTYTNFDCYVSQTYFILKPNRLNLKYLTVLLNSRLIQFWLRFKGKLQGSLFQIDKEPLLGMPIKSINKTIEFEFIFDYLTFLYNHSSPSVNQYVDNQLITQSFEDVLNMMVYELYFSQHMHEQELDVMQFIDTGNIFKDISNFISETEKAEVINNSYNWLQQHENPIRNRIILSSIKSKDIIRRINSVTN